jgi:hypothetical protein
MRDRNQDSDAAQSGRPDREDGDDRMERADAVPQPIDDVEADTHRTQSKAEADVHPDRDDLERADTDREDEADEAELPTPRTVPVSIWFVLRPISSSMADCFFCGEGDCDQVFVVKTRTAATTRAHAVHNRCVIDHMRLQALASEER